MGAPTSYLNQATVMQLLGRHAFTSLGTLKLAGWLAELEQRYRIVLYVADTTVTSQWTQTCIRQVRFFPSSSLIFYFFLCRNVCRVNSYFIFPLNYVFRQIVFFSLQMLD